MNANIGTVDRIIRIIIGAAMIGYAVFFANSPYAYLGWIGLVPLLSGAVGWCGFYSLLGLSTSKKSTNT